MPMPLLMTLVCRRHAIITMPVTRFYATPPLPIRRLRHADMIAIDFSDDFH